MVAFLWHSLSLFFHFFSPFSLFSLGSSRFFFPFSFSTVSSFLYFAVRSNNYYSNHQSHHCSIAFQLPTNRGRENGDKKEEKEKVKLKRRKTRQGEEKKFTNGSGGLSPYRILCLRQKLTKGCDISTRDPSLCAIDSTYLRGLAQGLNCLALCLSSLLLESATLHQLPSSLSEFPEDP